MNKLITPNKFATDLWGMMQMAIDEAVAVEREACAKICEDLHPGLATRVAAEHIRARGNT
jgi:hypothetical protein